MKILITGDDGFIGSHLKEVYNKRKCEIYGWGLDGIRYGDGRVYQVSLTKYGDVMKGLELLQPDIIIHCAGSADVSKSVEYPSFDMESNYITTHNILFSMKQLKMLKIRFVLLSSAAVYGNPVSLPIRENDRTMPLSPYALHKQAAEDICLFMTNNYNIDTKVVRIFSAYGPGLRKQIFWDMFQKVSKESQLKMWGSGYESRDYIYIDDLVQAIILIAEQAPKDEVIYNVANGEEVEIRKVASCFMKMLGRDEKDILFMGTRREGDPINWRADIRKLKNLGYIRKVSFEEGVRRYIKWIEKDI